MFKFITLLKRFIPPYKKYVFLSLLFNLFSTVFSLFSFVSIVPILRLLFKIEQSIKVYQPWTWHDSLKKIIDAVGNNTSCQLQNFFISIGPGNALIYTGAFLVLMTALKVGFAYLGSFYMIPIRTGVLRDLRTQLYKKIISLPIGFFTAERKGDIMSRMTVDVGEVEGSIMTSLDMVFKNPIMILIYLGVMFAMSWELSLFVLLLLPFSGWLIGKIGKSLRKQSTTGQQQNGEMLSQIEETLGGLRVVKAFNAERKLEERFSLITEKLRRTFNRINRRFDLAHPVSELIGTIVIAILIWFGGVLILSNRSSIDGTQFIVYIVVFYSIIAPSKELSRASYSIQRGLASLDRVDKILMSENTIAEPEKPEVIKPFSDKIEFRNLNFKYHTDWVLRDINLTVKKGTTVALVGQSGSGKSTLVDMLPRYYDPVKGEILMDGVNIKKYKTHDIRSQMGNVNQEAILFNDTFFNNIAFGVETATMEQVVDAAKIANAHDFIMATENGYESNIGDRGSKLSGGQRQRVSIARAILKNPPILILDEATSALDTESEKMVQEALENLMLNRTTLVVAHRLSTIKRADEICVMHEGQIVERGKHDELIALNGYYKRLCDMQSF